MDYIFSMIANFTKLLEVNDKIYLCILKDNKTLCRKFTSYIEANNYYHEKYKGKIIRSTMIPSPKYLPFDKFWISRKLHELNFWGDLSIYIQDTNSEI